jgi:hypothetical protein
VVVAVEEDVPVEDDNFLEEDTMIGILVLDEINR